MVMLGFYRLHLEGWKTSMSSMVNQHSEAFQPQKSEGEKRVESFRWVSQLRREVILKRRERRVSMEASRAKEHWLKCPGCRRCRIRWRQLTSESSPKPAECGRLEAAFPGEPAVLLLHSQQVR